MEDILFNFMTESPKKLDRKKKNPNLKLALQNFLQGRQVSNQISKKKSQESELKKCGGTFHLCKNFKPLRKLFRFFVHIIVVHDY